MSRKKKGFNFKPELYKELDEFIDSYEDTEGELIEILHKAQNIFGFLPEEVTTYIAKKINIPVSTVFGVVTFYSYFTTTPKGKYPISVCMGTACYVKGADKVLEEFEKELGVKNGETTLDGMFSLDSLRCVGTCTLAPVVLVGEDVHGKVAVNDVKRLIQNYINLNEGN